MLWPLRGRRNKRQIDLALGGIGELDLGFFSGFSQSLQSLLVLAQIDTFVRFERCSQVINDHFVEVITTEVGVTGGGQNFENTIANLQNRDIEGAAAEVKNQNSFVALFIEAVGQSRRCGLVDDAKHLKASDLSSILRRLAL